MQWPELCREEICFYISNGLIDEKRLNSFIIENNFRMGDLGLVRCPE